MITYPFSKGWEAGIRQCICTSGGHGALQVYLNRSRQFLAVYLHFFHDFYASFCNRKQSDCNNNYTTNTSSNTLIATVDKLDVVSALVLEFAVAVIWEARGSIAGVVAIECSGAVRELRAVALKTGP